MEAKKAFNKRVQSLSRFLALTMVCLLGNTVHGQTTIKDDLGSWYMSFWSWKQDSSRIGVQGDFQLRLYEPGADLEQTMLRSGIFYQPEGTKDMYTLGYANIQTGTLGPSTGRFNEDRVYLEALLPHKVGKRFYLRHRFRQEFRWVAGTPMQTRFRQAIFVSVPLNKTRTSQGAVYLAAYNEIFLKQQRNNGQVPGMLFNQNRLYGALGYAITDNQKVQAGVMRSNTEAISKMQWQLSLHSKFN